VEKNNYDSSLRNAQNSRGVFKLPKNVERMVKSNPSKKLQLQVWSVKYILVLMISFYMINIFDGSCKQLLLKSPRLKDAAVPSVFPNLAS
jgi:hypothetical protein